MTSPVRNKRLVRGVLAVVLVGLIGAGSAMTLTGVQTAGRTQIVAYFDNSNGIYAGDDVQIRGVTVGKIERIDPEPTRVKFTLWIEDVYPVPADAEAVILSPTLVTARAIQLTPPYRGGPKLADDAVIPQSRTAVPVEWDDFREQLEKLTETLQPTDEGGVSTLGETVNTAADNLRGQGRAIRESVLELGRAVSAMADHSDDTFTSVRNLAALVSALQGSEALLSSLNMNLASVTGALANDPGEVAQVIQEFDEVVGEVRSFVADNSDGLATTSEKLASVSTALDESLDDVKQLLHVLPNTAANAVNIYQPAQGTLSGIAALNNFSDPITFLCGAIQAASRLGAEQSSKLCVQYLAPIVKNRQYNFPPLGANPFVGTAARPNELTYSEDRLRPDYVPPAPVPPAAAPGTEDPFVPLAAEAPAVPGPAQSTDPAAGLTGMMVPAGSGS